MPIYEYECKSCGEEVEYYLSIRECDNPITCSCGKVMGKVMSRPSNNYCSGYPYHDKVLGQTINDPSHRKKVLKQHSLYEKG